MNWPWAGRCGEAIPESAVRRASGQKWVLFASQLVRPSLWFERKRKTTTIVRFMCGESYVFVNYGASLAQILQRAYNARVERSEMARVKLVAAMLLTLVASCGMALEHQGAHGERLGVVHFATSCNEAAQKEFNRAVALLHSFQFSRAIEGFNAVMGEDAACGIG